MYPAPPVTRMSVMAMSMWGSVPLRKHAEQPHVKIRGSQSPPLLWREPFVLVRKKLERMTRLGERDVMTRQRHRIGCRIKRLRIDPEQTLIARGDRITGLIADNEVSWKRLRQRLAEVHRRLHDHPGDDDRRQLSNGPLPGAQ